MAGRPPDVFEALFGDLPEGWRERKGLAPAASRDARQRQPPRMPGRAGADTGEAADRPPPPLLPGAPTSPWNLDRAGWVAAAKCVVKEFARDRVTSVSGGVTFFGLLALFPAITAMVSIFGLVADPATIGDNLDYLTELLPQGAVALISDQVMSIVSAPASSLSLAGIVSILVALWSAMGGMKALIEALNVAWYETEKRSFLRLNALALVLTLGAVLLVITLIIAIAVVPVLLNTLISGESTQAVLSLLRWPLMFGVLLLALAVVYRFGPSKEDAQWQWISPGALLAAVGLIVASVLFSWYVTNFANYNETYGALGAVVVLMMWLWIASMVVMTGAELNSELERQIKIRNGVVPEDHRAKE